MSLDASRDLVLHGSVEADIQPLELPPPPESLLAEPKVRADERLAREARRPEETARKLAGATWVLTPAGTFQLTPGPESAASALFPLAGFHRYRDGAIELQAIREVADAGSLSLDGFLAERDGAYELDAILALSASSRLVVRVQQRLAADCPLPSSRLVGEFPVLAPSEVSVLGRMDGVEPGSPSASWLRTGEAFDLQLSGHVDGTAFELEGWLFLHRAGQGCLSLHLGTAGDLQPGWLQWPDSHIDGAELIQGREVVALWEAERPRLSGQLGWYTAGPDGGVLHVAPRRLALRLRLLADRALAGSIEGQGAGIDLEMAESHFNAELRGRVQGSTVLERMQAALGRTVTFAGAWSLEDGEGSPSGELTVSSWRGKLAATVSGPSREIGWSGEEREGRLDLEIEPGQRLFLRRLSRSEAAGYRSTTESRQPLVARLAEPGPPGAALPDLLEASPADASALRFDAHRLMREGRHEEARQFLETSLEIYGRSLKRATPSSSRQNLVISMDSTLTHLLACDQQLLDTRRFLSHLSGARERLRDWQSLAPFEIRERIRALHKEADRQATWVDAMDFLSLERQSAESFPAETAAVAGAFRKAQAAQDGAIEPLRRHLLELAELAERGDEALGPPSELSPRLSAWAEEISTIALAANEQLLGQARAILTKAPDLSARWEEYVRVTAGESQPDLARIQELEKEQEGLAAHPSLTPPEGALVRAQTVAAGTWRMLAFSLALMGKSWREADGGSFKLATQALEAARASARRPEMFWHGLRSDRGKRQLLEELHSFFGGLVDFLFDLGHPGEALAVSEMARARAFADLLAGRREIRERLEQLGRETAPEGIPSPAAVEPQTLAEILEGVRRQERITVEYFVSSDRLTTWVLFPSGRIEAIQQAVEAARWAAWFPAATTSRTPVWLGPEGRHELYDLLIAPIEAWLPASPHEAILLVPHGPLLQISFAALEGSDGRFLIEKHPLTYAVSLAVQHQLEQRSATDDLERPDSMLALVDPEPLPTRAARPTGEPEEPLLPLPLLRQGFVARIAGFYPHPQVLVGRQATWQALKDRGRQAAVLHLATHAEGDPDDPLSTFIALAGEGEVGRLRIHEIFDLELKASLAILWACSTGTGQLTADGIQGLSRGFSWAGASSLLVTLWRIPERDSLRILEMFHQVWLRHGKSKAQALQQAQIEYCHIYPLQPEVWAGWALFGSAS